MSNRRKLPAARATRWYHGGVSDLEPGDQILPPGVTGAITGEWHCPTWSRCSQLGCASGDCLPAPGAAHVGPGYSGTVIYITRTLAVARVSAAFAPVASNRGGDLYEVAPDAKVRPDPDYLPRDGLQVTCRSATIVAVLERRTPREAAIDSWLARLMNDSFARAIEAERLAPAAAQAGRSQR